MNNLRRKEIEKLNQRLLDIQTDLEVLRDEEQEYFDSTPENLQESERCLNSEKAICNLEAVIDSISESIVELNEVQIL